MNVDLLNGVPRPAGNPGEYSATAAAYSGAASVLADLSSAVLKAMQQLDETWSGTAARLAQRRAGQCVDKLRRAGDLFSQAGGVLHQFAGSLRQAQWDYDQALRQAAQHEASRPEGLMGGLQGWQQTDPQAVQFAQQACESTRYAEQVAARPLAECIAGLSDLCSSLAQDLEAVAEVTQGIDQGLVLPGGIAAGVKKIHQTFESEPYGRRFAGAAWGEAVLDQNPALRRGAELSKKIAEGPAGIIISGVGAGIEGYKGHERVLEEGGTETHAVVEGAVDVGVTFAATYASADAMAGFGATVGTMIFPGPGTIVGGVLGGAFGYWAGETGAKILREEVHRGLNLWEW